MNSIKIDLLAAEKIDFEFSLKIRMAEYSKKLIFAYVLALRWRKSGMNATTLRDLFRSSWTTSTPMMLRQSRRSPSQSSDRVLQGFKGESDVNRPKIDVIQKCSKTSFILREASKSPK